MIICQKCVFLRHFRAIAVGLLWRKARSLWRYSCLGAILALHSASAQTLAPIGITASQSVTTNGQAAARLGPAGSVYLIGDYILGVSYGPTPTKSYGDTSKTAYYVSRIDATGKTVFTTALGAVSEAAMHIDSAGNVFVSGAALSTGFYTSPGAYRSSAPQNGWKFVCKLSATDGSAVYCTLLDYPNTDGSADGIDQQGNFIAVAGQAQFGGTTPPLSQGSLDAGSGHIYVAKLNPTGSALTYTAAFGGSGADIASVVTVDPAGNIFIAGVTTSPDFPDHTQCRGSDIHPVEHPTQRELSRQTQRQTGTTLLALHSWTLPEKHRSSWRSIAPTIPKCSMGTKLLSHPAYGDTTPPGHPFFSTHRLTSPMSRQVQFRNAAMAIDAAGNTTLVFSVSTITAPLVNPTGTCQVTTAMPFSENGFLLRFDPTGTVRQATYLTSKT